jgi:agmatinase
MTRDVHFLECPSGELLVGRPAILGCPLDMTSTFRGGSGEAPNAIRAASESIETYSPLLNRDLSDHPFADLGDVALPGNSLEEALSEIEETVGKVLRRGAFPLCIGGEHTVTLPIIRAMRAADRKFVVLHLDAHTDLRSSYEGNSVNHATVMRRIADIIGAGNLIQLGIRSGTREEFEWMRANGTLMQWIPGSEKKLLNRIGDRPVYLTLDLDVLDPACFPGTGNPEAGGWSYQDLERLLLVLEKVNCIGADVVELVPALDPSLISTIAAAKIVRELLLILGDR